MLASYPGGLDLDGQQLKNSLPENLATAPLSPVKSRTYYDTTLNKTRQWNGTAWIDLTSQFLGEVYTKEDKETVILKTLEATDAAATAVENAEESSISAFNALDSENKSKTSETNSKASEVASKLSETNSKASEIASELAETNSKTSETNTASTLETFREEKVELVKLSTDAMIIDNGFTPTFGSANQTGIDDVAGHFTSTKVEGALQEIGANLNSVESSLADKANQVDMDVKFGSMGSTRIFKGTCAFAALPVSGMLVDDYWYVTDQTTNRCWNGAAWVDIGNVLKIGDGSIAQSNLNFLPVIGIPSKNLFDISTAIADRYLATDTGFLLVGSGYTTSAFISALPNTQYVLKEYLLRVCFYNSSKVFISGVLASVNTFTTPPNTAFMRFTTWTGNVLLNQLELGSVATSYETFGTKLTKSHLNFLTANIVASKNLFNKLTAIADRYLYPDSGTQAVLADNTTSAFIAVLPTTVYSCLKVRQVIFYTATKTFISAASMDSKTVTTPSNCAYIKFYCYTVDVDIVQIEQGISTNYQSFGNFIDKTWLPNLGHNNMIVVAQDGTGDYRTIMKAVDRAGDSITNPVTILLMPGIYVESVDLRNGRYISIVGINKYSCVIINHSGNYFTPPVNLGGNAYIHNVTVIATHDAPILQSGKTFGDPLYLPSYGIHMDELGEGTSAIDNCRVISYHNSAIGMGTHNNQTNIINGCELLKLDTTSPYKESYAYIGALIAHNDLGNNSINQKLIVKNSRIYSDYGNALRLADSNHDTNGGMLDARDTEFSFYNNVIFSKTLKKACVTYNPTAEVGCLAGFIKLGEDSFGNNIPELNA